MKFLVGSIPSTFSFQLTVLHLHVFNAKCTPFVPPDESGAFGQFAFRTGSGIIDGQFWYARNPNHNESGNTEERLSVLPDDFRERIRF